jgi:hypothetical protein
MRIIKVTESLLQFGNSDFLVLRNILVGDYNARSKLLFVVVSRKFREKQIRTDSKNKNCSDRSIFPKGWDTADFGRVDFGKEFAGVNAEFSNLSLSLAKNRTYLFRRISVGFSKIFRRRASSAELFAV